MTSNTHSDERIVVPAAQDHQWADAPSQKDYQAPASTGDTVATEPDLIKLGDMAIHFAPYKPSEATLAELGFKPLKVVGALKLYDKRDIPSMLIKSAERLLANRNAI